MYLLALKPKDSRNGNSPHAYRFSEFIVGNQYMHPNFLGIGAQRSGTTWLDAQLRAHPGIYLPARRKEVHFFDQHYERGIGWYEKFFVDAGPAAKCIGEITPSYMYHQDIAAKISRHLPNVKLFVVLRNPADRAFSQYMFDVRDMNVRLSFSEYIEQSNNAFRRGFYGEQLRQYFDRFPRQNIKVLIFERVMAAPRDALAEIAEFLDIDANDFPPLDVEGRVNESYVPRFRKARSLAIKAARSLRSKDLDWIVNAANKLKVESSFGRKRRAEAIDPAVKAQLLEKYDQDIAGLESLVGIDLTLWRMPST